MGEPAQQLPYEILSDATDPDWLERRKSGLGASEIAIVMGASDWNSVLSLYYQKTGEEEREDEWVELLEWGKLLEPAIITELARRAEVTIHHPQPLIRSRTHTWALATPDGLTTCGRPVEAKNISHGYNPEAWEEQIPQKYYLQCHQQMLVSEADKCLFGALLWGSRMIWEWIPRDEQTIRNIVRAGSEFWRCVEARTPPPSDGHKFARRSLAKLAVVPQPIELFPASETETGHTVQDILDAWEHAESDYDRIAKEEKRRKRQREAARDEVAKLLGKHRVGFTSSGYQVEWKRVERRGYTVEPTAFDQLKIRAPKL